MNGEFADSDLVPTTVGWVPKDRLEFDGVQYYYLGREIFLNPALAQSSHLFPNTLPAQDSHR